MTTQFEELLSFLTPRHENAALKTYQNTTAIACPSCDKPFHNLLICKKDLTSLNLDEPMNLCITTTPSGSPMIFTHKQ